MLKKKTSNRKKLDNTKKKLNEQNEELTSLNIEQYQNQNKKKNINFCNHIKNNSIIYLIISSLINICLIFILLSQKNSKNTILPYYYDNNNNEHNKNNNINYNKIKINKEKNYRNPFLPFNKEEIIVKEISQNKI